MKRRKFLKTVGGATGAVALKAAAGPGSGSGNSPQVNPLDMTAKGRPTLTHSMEEIKAGGPGSTAETSTLRIRPAMWHPDGSPEDGYPPAIPGDGGNPPGSAHRKQVFPEEIVGQHRGDGLKRSFPVEFEYKGLSKKWILGGRLADTAPSGEVLLTQLVRDLAVKIRKYNASLYRLRRIHFCNKFKDAAQKKYWPHANPDGGDGWDDKDPTSGDVPGKVLKAEQDWCKVTKDLDDFIESAKTSYTIPKSPWKIQLVGLDMVEVNKYVVAMRVVVETPPGGPPPPSEVCGSSSQVSISSPFSSSSG